MEASLGVGANSGEELYGLKLEVATMFWPYLGGVLIVGMHQ